MSLVRSIGAIVFIAVAYTFLMFGAAGLPSKYETGVSVVVTLIGFAVVAWAFVPDRTPKP